MEHAARDRWHELWATFAVNDHCRTGAFVAEVLLYDRLVIPVPPQVRDGLTPEEADRERERWEHWDPRRQAELLAILGDRAERVPWTAARQAEWKGEMARTFADARQVGYFTTGSVLQHFVPAMARAVVAVSPYRSLAELGSSGIRRLHPDEKLPGSTLLATLGHELLMPDESDRDNFAALHQAVKVAGDPTYRARRRALFEWQQDFLDAGMTTDARSVRAAVAQMQRLVDELKTATAAQRRWGAAKKFFSFLAPASKGAALLFPPIAAVASAADATIAMGRFVADEGSGIRRPDAASLPAASLILDAREKLGL